MKLNPELEDLYLTFLKYPFITSEDLVNMCTKLINNVEVRYGKQRDIRTSLRLLRDHITTLLNDT